jgi:hypothetical protein
MNVLGLISQLIIIETLRLTLKGGGGLKGAGCDSLLGFDCCVWIVSLISIQSLGNTVSFFPINFCIFWIISYEIVIRIVFGINNTFFIHQCTLITPYRVPHL